MPAMTLNRAIVTRHAAGRADAYDAALLDVAQDHLLWLLAELGLFDDGRLVFKGGTALRKCRLGRAGRFSTDLDFAAPSEDKVVEVCEAIDGASETPGLPRPWSRIPGRVAWVLLCLSKRPRPRGLQTQVGRKAQGEVRERPNRTHC
jgi:hypothetical protein